MNKADYYLLKACYELGYKWIVSDKNYTHVYKGDLYKNMFGRYRSDKDPSPTKVEPRPKYKNMYLYIPMRISELIKEYEEEKGLV